MKFVCVVFELCERTDKQTNRHNRHNTPYLSRGEVKVHLLSENRRKFKEKLEIYPFHALCVSYLAPQHGDRIETIDYHETFLSAPSFSSPLDTTLPAVLVLVTLTRPPTSVISNTPVASVLSHYPLPPLYFTPVLQPIFSTIIPSINSFLFPWD